MTRLFYDFASFSHSDGFAIPNKKSRNNLWLLITNFNLTFVTVNLFGYFSALLIVYAKKGQDFHPVLCAGDGT